MKNVSLNVLAFWSKIRAHVVDGNLICDSYKNVNYSMRSDSRKHFIPELGIWAGNCFSFGNSKLSDNIAIFSLMEILTCLDCSTCAGTCYAKKSNRYATSYNHKLINTFLACNNLDLLKSFIVDDLQHRPKRIEFVRIHEAGDFFSQEYINMWFSVARLFPELKFYFYTKSDKYLDFSGRPENMNMVYSLYPNGAKNYGTIEDLQQLRAAYPERNIHLCSYGAEHAEKCGVSCTLCMNNPYVFFLEH